MNCGWNGHDITPNQRSRGKFLKLTQKCYSFNYPSILDGTVGARNLGFILLCPKWWVTKCLIPVAQWLEQSSCSREVVSLNPIRGELFSISEKWDCLKNNTQQSKTGFVTRTWLAEVSRIIFLAMAARSWWRHQMETFSALLALCAGNSPVTGEFPSQNPVTRSVNVFFHLCLNKRLNEQSWGWWFETPSRSLWRHRNVAFPFGSYQMLNMHSHDILFP